VSFGGDRQGQREHGTAAFAWVDLDPAAVGLGGGGDEGRTVAVGRKNWMFAGSAEGGHRAATIYSLVCTCGLLGIEPWAYLKDVLQKLAEGVDPAQLTPRIWKAARQQPPTA